MNKVCLFELYNNLLASSFFIFKAIKAIKAKQTKQKTKKNNYEILTSSILCRPFARFISFLNFNGAYGCCKLRRFWPGGSVGGN